MTMITTTPAARPRYTPADVERLSDRDGKLYELVGGELVEKHALVEKRVSTWSNRVAVKLGAVLTTAYPDAVGQVFIEQPTYCFPDGRMRRPDVALVWSKRLPPAPTHNELEIAPDFVAEVASPTNTFFEQQDRVDEYLRAGVPIVWVIDPRHGTVHIYRKDGPYDFLRADAVFSNEPLLPGLSFRVADIFPSTAPAPAPGS